MSFFDKIQAGFGFHKPLKQASEQVLVMLVRPKKAAAVKVEKQLRVSEKQPKAEKVAKIKQLPEEKVVRWELTSVDGRVSYFSLTPNEGLLTAIDRLDSSADHTHAKVCEGVVLTLLDVNGIKLARKWFASFDRAINSGERAQDKGKCFRYVVRTEMSRAQILSERPQIAGEPIRRRGPVCQRPLNYNRDTTWQKVSQDRCSFSHG